MLNFFLSDLKHATFSQWFPIKERKKTLGSGDFNLSYIPFFFWSLFFNGFFINALDEIVSHIEKLFRQNIKYSRLIHYCFGLLRSIFNGFPKISTIVYTWHVISIFPQKLSFKLSSRNSITQNLGGFVATNTINTIFIIHSFIKHITDEKLKVVSGNKLFYFEQKTTW